MSYRIEKGSGDIIFDGFDQGVAPSPHKGFANMQNVNLSTEAGEAINSFPRTQQTMTSSATGTGTLAFADSSHVSLDISGSNDLFKGNWITVTNSSHTGELPNGTYYVPPSTGANFQLQNYWNASATIGTASVDTFLVGGGGGGGSGNSGKLGGGGGGGGEIKTVTGTNAYSALGYVITVGAGGAGASGAQGGDGGSSSFVLGNFIHGGGISLSAAGGGGGAFTNSTGTAGDNGASGGGGAGTGAGGTGSVGKNGGTGGGTTASGGGGGGGFTVAGSNGASGDPSNGGAGGAGQASSFTGSSVTYSSGGGGGAGGTSGGSGGTGGTNAGNGGGNGASGGAATANTGSGGGGGGGAGTGNASGGNGSAGIVVIRALKGVITSATGGTHTSDSTYDYWTFTSSGVWTPTIANTPAPTNLLTGFTAGLTATIQLVANMGKPIAKCTETYYRSGTAYYRYYVLDANGLVWVYDTYNETVYSATDNVNWFLPDYHAAGTSATGIGVIDGMVMVATQNGLWAKSTSQLGNTNSQATNWTQVPDVMNWQSGSTGNTHFAFVGHQGRYYVTDGNYIHSVFPDSTLAQTLNNTTTIVTADNVQSLSSWTVDSGQTTPEAGLYGIASVIVGDQPYTADNTFLPAVFFTTGSLPYTISPNTVYYIKQSTTTGATTDFQVYVDPAMAQMDANTWQLTGNLSAGATSGTLTSNWTHATGTYPTTFQQPGGTQTIDVLYTNNSTAIKLLTPLSADTSIVNLIVYGTINLQTGAVGTQYFQTFWPLSANSDSKSNTPTYIFTQQALTLPTFEIAQCMGEIGNTMVIGCASNTLYPWDQSSTLPTNIISLPESNVQNIVTVHQMGYIFAGNKGNIYITDTSAASLVTKVPDYCAGVPGTPSSYIEPAFTWGDAMYLRGRVYFSIQDQTATKAGNCGGVWSFIPTQNFYIGQDVGISLHLENQNSYGSYNGATSVLIPRFNQDIIAPQYFSGWYSDVSSPIYGIDATGTGTSNSFTSIIETDAVPTGNFLDKKTFKQIEYRFASPIGASGTIAIYYRLNLTDAWTQIPTANNNTESGLTGYFSASFEKSQWLQLQAQLTPATSTTGSFMRLVQLRVR